MRPSLMRAPVAIGACLATAATLHAQQAPRPDVAPSSRVTTSVTFDGRVTARGGWFEGTPSHSGPSRITIDYGQPHARGRAIFGGLVPYGEVWRLGANWATSLVIDFPVLLGDLEVPRGEYSLFLVPGESGADLIVSSETRQWGTDYDETRDFGRTAMARRDLTGTLQSLSIVLEPVFPTPEGDVPSGVLRIAWGEVEYSVTWRMIWGGQ